MFETHVESHNNNVALSRDFKQLKRAIIKGGADRERAAHNICRLYGVKQLEALPSGIRAAAMSLLDQRYRGTWCG